MKKLTINSKYLNPLTDFGFHKLFGTESCKELLIDFLNEIIKDKGLITDIQYFPPEQWGYSRNDRRAVFDIFCMNEKEEYFIVEMQRAKQTYFRDRSIFYSSLPIRKQAPRGVWDYCLKTVYVVAVLDFVLFNEFEDDNEYVIESVSLTRKRTKTKYSDKLNFVFVELPKFRKTEEELETNVDKWLYILKNLSHLEDRPVSVQGKIFEDLFKLAEITQLTKSDMKEYKKSVLKYHDVRDAMSCAREESHEEGRKEEKMAIIQKCLQMNMPIEVIVNLTGFSEEQIIRFNNK